MINLLIWFICVTTLLCIYIKVQPKINVIKNINHLLVIVFFLLLCLMPPILDCAMALKQTGYYLSDMIKVEGQNGEERETVGELIEGDTIEQSFYCDYSCINSISLYTITYGRKNEGTLNVLLVNTDSNEEIHSWTVDLQELPSEDYLTLYINNPTDYDLYDYNYKLVIFTEGNDADNSITFLKTKDNYQYGELLVNGNTTDYDLVFSINGAKDLYNMERVRVLICLFFAAMFIFGLNRGWNRNNDQ